jgi:hypothetical protein
MCIGACCAGEEFESMRRSNFALRLLPSLMEEARKVAGSEGVALNQLINVAVAEKLSALRTEKSFQDGMRRAARAEALRVLDWAENGNPPVEGDERLMGGLRASLEACNVKVQPVTTPNWEDTGETGGPPGRATPRFGKLKRRLEKQRGW